MNYNFSQIESQKMKIYTKTWSNTAFHLMFGYNVLAVYFCILQFSSLGQLWGVDQNKVPKMNLVCSWMVFYILYSCYVIFRQTTFVLCHNPLVERAGKAIHNFLDDFVLLFYACYIPFLCLCTRELYDSYARHAVWCFATLPLSIRTLSVDIFFDFGIQLSLYLIPLLAFLYMIALIYKAIKYNREANALLENSNLPSSSWKSLREIIRGRTIITLKDFFWWVAVFIFWTALFILIVVLFQKVDSLLETPTIKPSETSSMAPMGGAFLGGFIDGLILFIIVALFFNILIRNIIFGMWDCTILAFPQLLKLSVFYNRTQGRVWFPYVLWGGVVLCFFLCNFVIYQIATNLQTR